MAVWVQLVIMVAAALLVTLGLIFAEWRQHLIKPAQTGIKAATAVVLLGVLISLFTVR